jgi:CheY-like chemotaxis protein
MQAKPVILVYDINNKLVDEVATVIGQTGRFTSINTYNEINAMDAVRQYNRGFGLLTNKLACIITGWNNHKKPRDQFLYRLREQERGSPLRRPTPIILVTEDHRPDLKRRALDPQDGNVCAYLHADDFRSELAGLLEKITDPEQVRVLNRSALQAFMAEIAEE